MDLTGMFKVLFNGRLEVPQICRTGVSEDYINEFAGLLNIAEGYEKGIDLFHIIKKVRKYQERFPSSEYKGVVNERNKSVIEEIDKLAEELSLMLKNNSRDIGKYYSLIKELTTVVREPKILSKNL